MSKENVEIARQLWRQSALRTSQGSSSNPDVEWHSFFALQGEAYHGHGGVRQYVTDIHEAFEDLHPRVDELLDGGEVVIGIGSVHYRGRKSGVETDSTAGWMFKFRRGKVIRFRAFSEPEQRLEALGLP